MDIQQNNGKQGVRTRHIDIRLTEMSMNDSRKSCRMWTDT